MRRQSGAARKETKRRRVNPVGTEPHDELLVDLSKLSRRETINRYHTIQKQLALVDTNPQFPNDAARESRRRILRAQLSLIGIEKYQNASRAGEKLSGGFDSSKWVMKEIGNHRQDIFKDKESIRLLDVGAIAHRFPSKLSADISDGSTAKYPVLGLDVTSIDLNPENSEAGRRVIKADFFDFAADHLRRECDRFDVVCLSLCVNFEGCPKRRGLMLHLASHIMHSGGMLCLVLPRACVENSRYFDEERLKAVLLANNLESVSTTYSARLMHSVSKRYAMREICTDSWVNVGKAIRSGDSRNNFAIKLDKSLAWGSAKLTRAGEGSNPLVKKIESGAPKLSPKLGPFKKRTSNQRKKARRQAKR